MLFPVVDGILLVVFTEVIHLPKVDRFKAARLAAGAQSEVISWVDYYRREALLKQHPFTTAVGQECRARRKSLISLGHAGMLHCFCSKQSTNYNFHFPFMTVVITPNRF